jgi:hypothetical protein
MKVNIRGIVIAAVLACAAAARLPGGTVLAFGAQGAKPESDSERTKVLREVAKKLSSGEKITPNEVHAFVDAQNHGATTGLEVGQKVPDFTLPDQNSKPRRFADLVGRSGLLLVFSRSADW